MTTMISHDVVSVFTYGRGDHRAECSCGYQGRQRVFKGFAVTDACIHAAREGCRDNQPMVWDSRDYRPTDAPSWRHRICGTIGLAAAFSICTIGLVVIPAPAAHADTQLTNVQVAYVVTWGRSVVCPALTANHTTDAVIGVTRSVMTDGFTAVEAVEVVATSVWNFCPENWPLLEQVANSAPAQGKQLV